MAAIFHDLIHQIVEVYVVDLVVKSRQQQDHLADLETAFNRCRKFQLKMNPLKCIFGVTARKFLGCLVHQHGIDADEAKIQAIRDMPPLHFQKSLKCFLGRVSYLH